MLPFLLFLAESLSENESSLQGGRNTLQSEGSCPRDSRPNDRIGWA